MISAFDGTIERVVALAALMPIVAGMAGNSGNQTLTLLVRSLATGQVTLANTIDIWKKELAVAVVNGLLWGAIAGLCAWALYWDSPQGPYARSGHGACDVPQHRPGSGGRTCCAAYSQ